MGNGWDVKKAWDVEEASGVPNPRAGIIGAYDGLYDSFRLKLDMNPEGTFKYKFDSTKEAVRAANSIRYHSDMHGAKNGSARKMEIAQRGDTIYATLGK